LIGLTRHRFRVTVSYPKTLVLDGRAQLLNFSLAVYVLLDKMAPVKIKLRCQNHVAKELIVDSLIKFHVKFSRILDNLDRYSVYCNSYEDSDSLFSTSCILALRALNCQPILPPDIAVNKCVIVRYLDCSIYDRHDDEIRAEIESENNVKIIDFFKFPKAKSFKITFLTLELASRVINKGLKMFHFSVPPCNIERDVFIKLTTCFKCYTVDTHTTVECPKDSSYKICSECSSPDHTFRFCKAGFKKCINCDGDHSSLAFRCPYRKAAERNRRSNSNNNISNKLSYSSATKESITTDRFCSSDLTESLVRANMCIMIASMENNNNPGAFQSTLNSLLTTNGLPSFNMGEVKPPRLSSGNFSVTDVERKLTTTAVIPDAVIATHDSDNVQRGQSEPSTRPKQGNSIKKSNTAKLKDFKIFKRMGIETVNRRNLKKLANKGSVIVLCDSLTEQGGIEYLTALSAADGKIYFQDIKELEDDDFNKILLEMTTPAK